MNGFEKLEAMLPEIEQLATDIMAHKYLYYEVGQKVISDPEYDQIKNMLFFKVEQVDGDTNKVVSKGFDYNHPMAMGGIIKAKHAIGV